MITGNRIDKEKCIFAKYYTLCSKTNIETNWEPVKKELIEKI
jgi:uncharacterized Fe-S center protein